MPMENLRWVSWAQHGDHEYEPDYCPVAWPPQPASLASALRTKHPRACVVSAYKHTRKKSP